MPVKNLLRAFILLLAPLMLSQCNRPEEPVPPAQLIPRDKMIRVLIDLHLVESRVEAASLPRDSSRALYNQQMKALYQKHRYTQEAFQQSFQYYAIHGKDLDQMYEAVIDSLSVREMRLEGGLTKK